MRAKKASKRNKTLQIDAGELAQFKQQHKQIHHPCTPADIENHILCQETLTTLAYLPANQYDLIFADPPYRMRKTFQSITFNTLDRDRYAEWLNSWISQLPRIMKANASIYICGDWRSSSLIEQIASQYFYIHNRITWEREKGRGAQHNWKNASEDIWFCSLSREYAFNVDAVKSKRRVLAPYKEAGHAKDWSENESGRYRLTHPSNLWTDLTVPFWSMTENTTHPTQKPEKLLARILLASSQAGDWVLDPFLGSGTAAVVAKKLGRVFTGIELDPYYASVSLKRLSQTRLGQRIQGYEDGVFLERNTQ
ncbi:adenine-specific DNA-methyltransferase [Anaerolineales bacterium]